MAGGAPCREGTHECEKKTRYARERLPNGGGDHLRFEHAKRHTRTMSADGVRGGDRKGVSLLVLFKLLLV